MLGFELPLKKIGAALKLGLEEGGDMLDREELLEGSEKLCAFEERGETSVELAGLAIFDILKTFYFYIYYITI